MDIFEGIEVDVSKLELGRREILVIRPSRALASVVAAELRAKIERQLDLSGRVLIVDPGVEIAALGRGEVKKLGPKGEGG